MADTVTVETPADPWTSDSSTPTTVPEPPQPAEPTPPVIAPKDIPEGAEPEPEPAAATEKPKSKRTNPYEAVKAATGETAKERGLREAAEARAAEAERKLSELTAKPKEEPKPAPKPSGEPKFEDYQDQADPLDAYFRAMAKWEAKQSVESPDLDQRFDAYLQRREQHQQHVAHIQDINTRARETYADFAEVVASNTVVFPEAHLEAIANIEGSEHVIYALAKDAALAQRIAGLDNPILVAVELAKLVPSSAVVARPDSIPTARSSSAKPPINRVGGTASAVPVDPDDLDFGPDYIRAENEREKKRQQASRW